MTTTQTAAPITWISTVYTSRSGRTVKGVLSVEGATRNEARALLARMVNADGAAGEHARAATGGMVRHTLVRDRGRRAYAAADGSWRGWNPEAWKQNPPAAYARWSK